MAGGWIAQGPDTPTPDATAAPAPAPQPKQNAIDGSWHAVGADVPATQVKPGAWKQVGDDRPTDPHAYDYKPAVDTRGTLQKVKDTLMGSDDKPGAPATAGILPAANASWQDFADRVSDSGEHEGPEWNKLAEAYPHILKAKGKMLASGYQEAVGASDVQSAEVNLAALNVLPQVAARTPGDQPADKIQAMAKDPLVRATAIKLGMDPLVFAGKYAQVATMNPERQADSAAQAQATLKAGQDNVTSGRNKRLEAGDEARVWTPSDSINGQLDPWTMKGLAFNTAVGIPELAAVTGASLAGTAVGSPALGVTAGGVTAAALFAPQQRAQVKTQIEQKVTAMLDKADLLDQTSGGGQKNAITDQLRQQAADLAKNSDQIANTAGVLYAVADAAGAIPVSAVLSKSPGAQAVLDRIVGSAITKTAGGRVAGGMIANGAGGIVQASLQQAIDAGVIHTDTSLSDALKDIAYSGVLASITALPISATHEALGAPGRARAQRNMDADALKARVEAATAAPMDEPIKAAGEDYPGYTYNESTKRYEPTGSNPETKAPPGRISAPSGETSPPNPETPGSPAAPSPEAYKAKIDALNAAASKADKRGDVTLEPEEEGWSVHVKGQQVATFDSVADAREAMAQARKLVGTAVTAANNSQTANDSHKAPPEGPLERTQPLDIPPDRRQNPDLRGRVDQMGPEQLRAALLTHELTGIPNRRAYAESPKKPAQASIDVDSLKWINDNAGHPGGDELLKTVAQALHEESGGNAFHISGDEFAVQGDSQEALESTMARAKDRLAGATLTFQHPDGRTVQLKGVGLSHGTGRTLEDADANLAAAKEGRQSQGLRAARGEQPPGASIAPGQAGLQTGQGQPTAEVLGQKVTPPAEPTPAQAEAGNYRKPEVSWHGLPIKLENLPGSKRPFTYPDGRKGSRVMKAPYGYFPGKTGADGDGVDVFTAPGAKPDAGNAYIIDQLNGEGTAFDEHKVIVGAGSAEAAKKLYLDHYQKGWKGLGAITRVSPEGLKSWLNTGDLKAPVAWKPPKARTAPPIPKPDATKDTILQYLAKHPRGIDREEASAQGIDPADMKQREAFVGIRSAFRKGGMSFDEAAEHLHESGFPVADEHGHYNPNTLLDRISGELKGTPSYSVHNQAHTEALAAEEMERRLMSEDAQARHIAPGVPDLEAETPEVIDWVKLADEARKYDADAVERALERDDDAVARTELEGIVSRGREAEGKLARGAPQGEGAPAAAGSHPSEEELLESHTEADLAARARAGDAAAKAELAADVKHSIDKDLGQFELTGSARPSDANPRQRDLLDLSKVKEPEAKYSTTVAEAKSRAPTGSPRQMDIFANVKAPQAAHDAARAKPAQVKHRVVLRQAGTFKSGFTKIETWQQAAHILAPLRKSPQEIMAALVLDKDRKPLAVIKHTMGQVDAADVERFSLVGAIAQVPGVSSVYLAHNHPSGRHTQSDADLRMTKALTGLMQGSGIKLHGMFVVAYGTDRSQYHEQHGDQEHLFEERIAAAARNKVDVPEMVRRRTGAITGENPALGRDVKGPSQAREAVVASGLQSGMLFADRSGIVKAVIPMDAAEMKRFRTGDQSTGTAHLLRTAAEANTKTLIAFGPLKRPAIANVQEFAVAAGMELLDVFRQDSEGDWASQRVANKIPAREMGAFLARAGLKGAGLPAAQVQYGVHRILEHFAVKPKGIVVAQSAADLQKDPDIGHLMTRTQLESAVGFFHQRTGKIYLIADQIHSMDQLAGVLAHEYVVHFGLRAAFGSPRDAQYQAILDGVKQAMPAEVASRGRAEVGADYDPGRTSHTNVGAEEALAYYSQKYSKGQSVPSRMRRFVDRLIGMVRDFIRRVLGLPKKFDAQFIKSTLADLESYLRRGDNVTTPDSGIEPQFSKPADTFYSGLAKAVDAAKREKGTGAEWEATLRNMPGVKKEEMDWSGIKGWLEGRGRVSKAEVAEYVDAHRVQLGEVTYGGNGKGFEKLLAKINALGYNVDEDVHGDPELVELQGVDHDIDLDATDEERDRANEEKYQQALDLMHKLDAGNNPNPKYKDWATPGGENYREMLMTLPETAQARDAKDLVAKTVGDRLRAETDARVAERMFIEMLPENDALLRANAIHWLYDAHSDDPVFAKEAKDKLVAAVKAVSPALRSHAAMAMRAGLRANLRLRTATRADNSAQLQAKALRGTYESNHWKGVPNVLAHIRFDDRTGPNGEKVLHIHEVQSDWHQKGRKAGYITPDLLNVPTLAQVREPALDAVNRLDNLGFDSQSEALGNILEHADWAERWPTEPGPDRDAIQRYRDVRLEQNAIRTRSASAVADAPFKTSWPELAMKRMLRMAVDGGYDKLSWDTGTTNAERYNMSHVVDRLEIGRATDGFYIKGTKENAVVAAHSGMTDEKLASYVGKDMAQKAIQKIDENQAAGRRLSEAVFTGDSLRIGGAGMRGFYDDILPKAMAKMVKKWGSSVGPLTFDGGQQPARPRYQVESRANEHVAFNPADQYDFQAFPTREQADAFAAQGGTVRPSGWENTGQDVVASQPLKVHSIDITPAMRESVLGGQPMFLKKQKGGPPAPPKGKGAVGAGYELARRAVAAIPNNEFTMSFRRIADPSGVSDPAKVTALLTRAALGELAHNSEEALQQLQRFAKTFDLLGKDDALAFIDAMEEGRKQPIPEHQGAADAIRAVLDHWREQVQGLGIGALANFYENYFPHIWQDPAGAKKAFAKIFGRRPMKGPASFLKQRTYATTKEGLAAGLTPISHNPLILAFAKVREMQRFFTGVKLIQALKDQGLAPYVPAHKRAAEGMSKIEDAVGRVMQWSEAEQGFIIRGHYYMPDDAARIINNHLGVSALANFMPARLFRSLTNMVTPLQLAFSAFHLGFTTLDAVVSKVALGVERLAHGEPLQAAKAFLESSTFLGAAGMNISRGILLRRAYTNVGAANPLMQRLVAGLEAAGARVKMDNYYAAGQGRSPFRQVGFTSLAHEVKAALTQDQGKVAAVGKAVGNFPREYSTRLWHDLQHIWREASLPALETPLEVAGRTVRASTAIIMEQIVPLQKLGVFSDLAADHIRRNPEEPQEAFASAMQKIWDSVDNRLGEMVYDNLFWNRTFKEVNHMVVRAVGWNLGTVRELGGAPIDVIKLMDYMARGAPPEDPAAGSEGENKANRMAYEHAKSTWQRIAEKIGHKIPYTIGLLAVTMTVAAVLQYLFTGKGPQETKDYFFPRTGRPTKYGTPERMSLPSYVKDLYEYGTQPMNTVFNKANPIFGIMHSLYSNEDFFGEPTRGIPGKDSTWTQLKEGAAFAARETVPFSIQGTKQFAAAGEDNTSGALLQAAPFIGLTPAPARVTSPEQMEDYQRRETEKAYIRGLYRKLKAATDKGDKPEMDRLRQLLRENKVDERETENKIRANKIKAREAAKTISSLVDGKSKPEAVAALKAAGYPAFATLWDSLPDRPRPRVAESLEAFA